MPHNHNEPGRPVTVYYKALGPGGRALMGDGTWHLPAGGRPGKWMPEITDLVPCQRGYHVATDLQLVNWLGPELFETECRGEHIDHGDKHVFSQARLVRRLAWDDRTARLFAADIAERVLPVFEAHRPGDKRPHRAIDVARAFANSQATVEDLIAVRDLAMDAARAVTKGAAHAAAMDAAWAAAWAASGEAAWAAARAAAKTAAWAAAMATAGDVARTAAMDAARDAAWDVARDMAWAAVKDAARDAALAAEREWQARRLFQLIGADQ